MSLATTSPELSDQSSALTKHAHVVVFDSGVGGLSICQALCQQWPELTIRYLMDNAAFPYGVQQDSALLERVLALCSDAVARWQPDLIIMACNTASTLTLPTLRKHLTIPVIGVVPAIKVAAKASNGHPIGLLATPATVNRPYIDDLINAFAPDIPVRKLGSEALVRWAEAWVRWAACDDANTDNTVCDAPTLAAIHDHLDDWLHTPEPLSHVVLGCTHFPLLTTSLQELWPHIHWVDSTDAIAKRMCDLLSQRDAPVSGGTALPCGFHLYQTHMDDDVSVLVAFIARFSNVLSYQKF